MSKNLTRKGLALGAALALGSTLFAGTPATAAGLYVAGYVPLSPSTGDEYYVLTGSQLEFSLKSNPANAAIGSGKFLKFLVTDASKTIAVDDAKSSQYSVASIAAEDTVIDDDHLGAGGTTDLVTVEVAAHNFKDGDLLTVSGDPGSADANGSRVVYSHDATHISFEVPEATFSGDDAIADDDDVVFKLRTPAYNSDNQIVFNTKVDSNSANKTLVLETASAESAARSATVTAWVDNNDDDVIDAGEYVSDTRTINWVKPSDLTITTTIDPVTIADTSLTASAVTSPVLNGTQVANTAVYAAFTREGSAQTETDTTGTWSNTTKKWTFSQTLVPSSGVYDDLKNVAIATASEDGSNVTVNTVAETLLATNNYAVITGLSDTDGTDGSGDLSKVAQVTKVDADTFTYAASGTYTLSVVSGMVGLPYAVAGTYTATAKADTSTTDEKVGTVATYATAVAKVSTVTTAVTTAAGVAADGDVKTGTKSIVVTATLKDSASAVLSGRSVKVTASGITGTFYLNGTKVVDNDVVWVTSNASGVATVTVTSDTAATSDNLDLAFTSEGVNGTAVNLDWEAASYSIVETTAGDASTNNFSVNKGGSTTLNVAVVDQWGAALTGDYRVFATGTQNSSFATPYTLSNGRASISVTDNQVVGGNGTVAVEAKLQKLVSGSWSNTHGLTGGSTRNFVVTVVDQTDAVLLDADASTAYGSGTADLSDSVAATAPKAVANSILDNGSIFDDGGSNAGVLVSGRVGNATTNAGRSGASVTISGPSSVLFTYGNKSGFGSLSFVADTSGEFAVAAFSTVAQKDSVVTVTSGSVSKTAKITFTALAAVNTGITFSPVVKSAAGRTIDLSVKFTDKWGNLTSTATAGTATFTSTGPGWLTSSATITSVDGIANVKLITSPEDAGLATITATTNVNDDDGVAIKLTKSILVGVSAKITKATTSKVTVKNANGLSVKVVRGTKSVTKTASSDSYKLSLKGGKGTVKVYVNGVLVASKK